MARFAEMRTMDIWYARLSAQDLLDALSAAASSSKGADKKLAEKVAQEHREGARRRHTRATACRRCRSWPSKSTASTAS